MEFVLLTSKNISLLLLLLLVMTCFAEFRSDAQILPDDEVEALKAIATKLNYKDWNATNVNSSSCNGLPGLIPLNKNYTEGGISNVTCNCTFNSSTTCHVTNIQLMDLNLSGTLPIEFGNLLYLQEINLTRNYLNGTIPREWGSTQLVDISLPGNRLTGSIPKEFGNITTLRNLTVESNQLLGNLPPELGNLSHIETLRFSSNNFTGELPTTFAKLTTLKDFRISENNFTGAIPNFTTNWTNLERLEIMASGLDGPIPPGIASLENITILRISDLNGTNTFPPVYNMRNLEQLILRSCNITGEIPDYLGDMNNGNLTVLDLSFNRLSGEIPSSFKNRSGLDFLFLTGNLLVGSILDRITNSRKKH